jgi:hypothetical protein
LLERRSGAAKQVILLENIMIFFKILASISIRKHFQEYCYKLKNFSKLSKPEIMALHEWGRRGTCINYWWKSQSESDH